jgi:hypothetical protein
MRNLKASLGRVVATGEPDSMALQRYDVEAPDRPGAFDVRYWSPVNAPVHGPDGRVALIVHRVDEVTELIRARSGRGGGERARVLEAELYTRARELQEVNERLRRAHAQEREVAPALQEAMLPAPKPVGRCSAAVRYRPAARTVTYSCAGHPLRPSCTLMAPCSFSTRPPIPRSAPAPNTPPGFRRPPHSPMAPLPSCIRTV